MKKCQSCNTYFETKRYTCPFCKSNLDECEFEENKNVKIVHEEYPSYTPDKHKKHFVLRLFIFLTLVIVSVVGVCNYLYNKNSGLYIFLIVLSSMGVAWAFIRGVIIARWNFPLRILMFGLCIFALMWIIDYDYSNKSWALNYILPFILTGVGITIDFSIFLKIKRFSYYFGSLLFVILLLFVPTLLLKIGVVSVTWPQSLPLLLAIANLLGVILFGWKKTFVEISKIFHI